MTKKPASDVRMTDGTFDWSGGVDSIAVPTVVSTLTPNGLQRNQLAWLNNGTVRDGGIRQRSGWNKMLSVADGKSLFQGGYIYQPDYGEPYLVCSIGGEILSITLNSAPAITSLSAASGLYNPSGLLKSYFVQGEQFLVIQAGDLVTLPLFYDGISMRRSTGLTPGYAGYGELPPATCMDYYMGRIWYAGKPRTYCAGDIVQGPSGTLIYGFRDAILKVTENPLAIGGDGFIVPSTSGDIRSICHSANIDVAQGQGKLFIGTPKAVYSLSVPVTRSDWIAADATKQPFQAVAQIGNGMVNDRSVVRVNGDLFFQSLEPSVRSLAVSTRYFGQWGNTPISANEFRAMQFNDRSLMAYGSGIEFDNRMLQAILPRQSACGVAHDAIIPLDYTSISDFGRDLNPVWEGMYDGLGVLQLYTASFGGLERAFALTVSKTTGEIELWELTTSSLFENGDNRITTVIETASYHWDSEYELKQLESIELFFDQLWGKVDFQIWVRPDQHPCWFFWGQFEECAARTSAEAGDMGYPVSQLNPQYRASRIVGRPAQGCNTSVGRPFDWAYQFQVKIVFTGRCRLRGLLLHAFQKSKSPFDGLACNI
jgi:hypothetical protein